MNDDNPHCHRFEREALLCLERGETLDAHFTSCPGCGEAYRKHLCLLAALPHADAAMEPPAGWQAGVLAALGSRSEVGYRWQSPGIGRATMVAAFAGAAALTVIAAWSPTRPVVEVQPVVEMTGKAGEVEVSDLPAQKPPANPPSARKPAPAQRAAAGATQAPAQGTEPDAPAQSQSLGAPEPPGAVVQDGPSSDEPVVADSSPGSDGAFVHPTNLDACIVTYTPEAYAAQVKGLVVVRCTIKANGQNTNCRVLRGLPHMNEAVVEAMNQCRTAPVTLDGQPVENSEHTWYIRLLPPPPPALEPPELRGLPSPILENPLRRRFRFSR